MHPFFLHIVARDVGAEQRIALVRQAVNQEILPRPVFLELFQKRDAEEQMPAVEQQRCDRNRKNRRPSGEPPGEQHLLRPGVDEQAGNAGQADRIALLCHQDAVGRAEREIADHDGHAAPKGIEKAVFEFLLHGKRSLRTVVVRLIVPLCTPPRKWINIQSPPPLRGALRINCQTSCIAPAFRRGVRPK